jgi:hypothetical protein
MEYSFNVKFVIFDENKQVSEIQQQLRKTLIYDELRNIIKKIFINDNTYKFLDRFEASVSSIDEYKQLRLSLDTIHENLKQYQHSLHFHQNHSCCKTYFTIEELKYISNRIKIGLEDYLNYKIDNPIIYIEVDEFN